MEAGRRIGAGTVSRGAEEAGVVPGREEEEVRAEDRQAADSLGTGLRHHGAHQPGKTLPAAILDLAIDKRTDPTLGTVAVSRVRSRHDVLIVRPFPLWLFQRGAPEGPKLLLQSLRGEEVDWKTYREARRPSATCQKCRHVKVVDAFSNAQSTCRPPAWLASTRRIPRLRGSASTRAALPILECSACKVAKIEDAFPRAQLKQEGAPAKRRCLQCVKAATTLTCTVCSGSKPLTEFEAVMVTLTTADVICKPCQEEAEQKGKTHSRQGWFTCKGCKGFFQERPGLLKETSSSGTVRIALLAAPVPRTSRSAGGVATCSSTPSKRGSHVLETALAAGLRLSDDSALQC